MLSSTKTKKQTQKEQEPEQTQTIIKIKFQKRVYEISTEKLYHVIKKLKQDDSIEFKDYKTAIKHLKELKLYNEEFLKNVIKL